MATTTNSRHAETLQGIGQIVIRYGLVVVFLWIGLLKFTAYEAANIEPFVANSPLFAWAYQMFGLRMLSNLIGVIEISIGLLIATRAFAPKLSAIGSMGSIVLYVTTLSFMLTTPGVWEPGYGFPAPSALPGQFLAKDLVLLGVSIWTAGEALKAANRNRPH
ncbi:MAG: YkgB family protein [Gammaproteobacteria bacterium]